MEPRHTQTSIDSARGIDHSDYGHDAVVVPSPQVRAHQHVSRQSSGQSRLVDFLVCRTRSLRRHHHRHQPLLLPSSAPSASSPPSPAPLTVETASDDDTSASKPKEEPPPLPPAPPPRLWPRPSTTTIAGGQSRVEGFEESEEMIASQMEASLAAEHIGYSTNEQRPTDPSHPLLKLLRMIRLEALVRDDAVEDTTARLAFSYAPTALFALPRPPYGQSKRRARQRAGAPPAALLLQLAPPPPHGQAPSVCDSRSLCAFTPHYAEDVTYSMEALQIAGDDNASFSQSSRRCALMSGRIFVRGWRGSRSLRRGSGCVLLSSAIRTVKRRVQLRRPLVISG